MKTTKTETKAYTNRAGHRVLPGYWIVKTANGRRFYANRRTEREAPSGLLVIAYRECTREGDDLWHKGSHFEERVTMTTRDDIKSERRAVLNLRYERIEAETE